MNDQVLAGRIAAGMRHKLVQNAALVVSERENLFELVGERIAGSGARHTGLPSGGGSTRLSLRTAPKIVAALSVI